MGGPNLEVFKFGMYIFFPIGWMYYFGTNLDQRFSIPDFWPKQHETNQIPFEREDIAEELNRLKAKRLEARNRRLAIEAAQGTPAAEETMGRVGGTSGESPILKSLENTRVEGLGGEERQQQQGGGWFKKLW